MRKRHDIQQTRVILESFWLLSSQYECSAFLILLSPDQLLSSQLSVHLSLVLSCPPESYIWASCSGSHACVHTRFMQDFQLNVENGNVTGRFICIVLCHKIVSTMAQLKSFLQNNHIFSHKRTEINGLLFLKQGPERTSRNKRHSNCCCFLRSFVCCIQEAQCGMEDNETCQRWQKRNALARFPHNAVLHKQHAQVFLYAKCFDARGDQTLCRDWCILKLEFTLKHNK